MTNNNLTTKSISELTLSDEVVDTQSIISTIDNINSRLDGIDLRSATEFDDIIQILQEITERFGNTRTLDGYIVLSLEKDTEIQYI